MSADEADEQGAGASGNARRVILRWTPDEHRILLQSVADCNQRHGGRLDWVEVAEHVPGRTSKQCRHRWVNSCQPSKNGPFSAREEFIIAKLHAELGTAWSQISPHLPGRSDNSIKNLFNALIRNKKLTLKHSSLLARYAYLIRDCGQPANHATFVAASGGISEPPEEFEPGATGMEPSPHFPPQGAIYERVCGMDSMDHPNSEVRRRGPSSPECNTNASDRGFSPVQPKLEQGMWLPSDGGSCDRGGQPEELHGGEQGQPMMSVKQAAQLGTWISTAIDSQSAPLDARASSGVPMTQGQATQPYHGKSAYTSSFSSQENAPAGLGSSMGLHAPSVWQGRDNLRGSSSFGWTDTMQGVSQGALLISAAGHQATAIPHQHLAPGWADMTQPGLSQALYPLTAATPDPTASAHPPSAFGTAEPPTESHPHSFLYKQPSLQDASGFVPGLQARALQHHILVDVGGWDVQAELGPPTAQSNWTNMSMGPMGRSERNQLLLPTAELDQVEEGGVQSPGSILPPSLPSLLYPPSFSALLDECMDPSIQMDAAVAIGPNSWPQAQRRSSQAQPQPTASMGGLKSPLTSLTNQLADSWPNSIRLQVSQGQQGLVQGQPVQGQEGVVPDRSRPAPELAPSGVCEPPVWSDMEDAFACAFVAPPDLQCDSVHGSNGGYASPAVQLALATAPHTADQEAMQMPFIGLAGQQLPAHPVTNEVALGQGVFEGAGLAPDQPAVVPNMRARRMSFHVFSRFQSDLSHNRSTEPGFPSADALGILQPPLQQDSFESDLGVAPFTVVALPGPVPDPDTLDYLEAEAALDCFETDNSALDFFDYKPTTLDYFENNHFNLTHYETQATLDCYAHLDNAVTLPVSTHLGLPLQKTAVPDDPDEWGGLLRLVADGDPMQTEGKEMLPPASGSGSMSRTILRCFVRRSDTDPNMMRVTSAAGQVDPHDIELATRRTSVAGIKRGPGLPLDQLRDCVKRTSSLGTGPTPELSRFCEGAGNVRVTNSGPAACNHGHTLSGRNLARLHLHGTGSHPGHFEALQSPDHYPEFNDLYPKSDDHYPHSGEFHSHAIETYSPTNSGNSSAPTADSPFARFHSSTGGAPASGLHVQNSWGRIGSILNPEHSHSGPLDNRACLQGANSVIARSPQSSNRGDTSTSRPTGTLGYASMPSNDFLGCAPGVPAAQGPVSSTSTPFGNNWGNEPGPVTATSITMNWGSSLVSPSTKTAPTNSKRAQGQIQRRLREHGLALDMQRGTNQVNSSASLAAAAAKAIAAAAAAAALSAAAAATAVAAAAAAAAAARRSENNGRSCRRSSYTPPHMAGVSFRRPSYNDVTPTSQSQVTFTPQLASAEPDLRTFRALQQQWQGQTHDQQQVTAQQRQGQGWEHQQGQQPLWARQESHTGQPDGLQELLGMCLQPVTPNANAHPPGVFNAAQTCSVTKSSSVPFMQLMQPTQPVQSDKPTWMTDAPKPFLAPLRIASMAHAHRATGSEGGNVQSFPQYHPHGADTGLEDLSSFRQTHAGSLHGYKHPVQNMHSILDRAQKRVPAPEYLIGAFQTPMDSSPYVLPEAAERPSNGMRNSLLPRSSSPGLSASPFCTAGGQDVACTISSGWTGTSQHNVPLQQGMSGISQDQEAFI